MEKKRLMLLSLIMIITIIVVSLCCASVSLDSVSQSKDNIMKGQIFNIEASVSCKDNDCNNFSIGLKIPNLETSTYDSSVSDKDCFSGTCLSAPSGSGPLYNSSGEAIWGCGKCFSGPVWAGNDMRQLVDVGCFTGLKFIAGVNLCFAADNGERWDVVFSSWPVGGTGKFVYTRSIERGLLGTSSSSLPFQVISSENPKIVSLNSGESQTFIFNVKATGEPGIYSNMVFFAADKDSDELTVNITDDSTNISTNITINITINNTNLLPIPVTVQSKHGTGRHYTLTNQSFNRTISGGSLNGSGNNLYININVTTDNLNLGKKNLSLTLKNQTAIGSLFKTKIFWTYFIVVCALIIVLIVLLLIFKRRYPKANFSVD